MCESNVYVVEGEQENLLMEDVGWLETDGETVVVKDILGRRKTFSGHLLYADFVQHRIVLEPAEAR